MHISNLMHLPCCLWRTLSDAFVMKKKKGSWADMKSKWRGFHKNYEVSFWPQMLWWGLLKRCHVPALRTVNTHQSFRREERVWLRRGHTWSVALTVHFFYLFLKHGAVTAWCDGMSIFTLSLPKRCVRLQEASGSHWRNVKCRPFCQQCTGREEK